MSGDNIKSRPSEENHYFHQVSKRAKRPTATRTRLFFANDFPLSPFFPVIYWLLWTEIVLLELFKSDLLTVEMQFLQNMTLVFLRPSTNSNSPNPNIFFMQTQDGETIPFEFGLLTLPPCLDQSASKSESESRSNATLHSYQHGESIHAVIYVGVVLMVYACIIMMMIATNIKRQRLEGEDADYYEEFLQKRDHFKYAQLVAEARQSVEPHVKRAASIHPSTPLFTMDQLNSSNSPILGGGMAPSIVIQSA